MLVAFVFVAILVGLTAAAGAVQSNLAIGLICSLLAVSMIAIAVARRGAHLGQLHRTFRPLALIVVLLLPISWMLLQVAPVPNKLLANAAWSSTSSALGFPIAGSISIDTGATLLALAQYCAALATAAIVSLLAFDRRIAELTLCFLTLVASSAATLRIIYSFAYFDLTQQVPGTSILAAIGITLTVATAIRFRERLLSRRSSKQARRWAMGGLAACAVAMIICTAALLIEADTMLLFASFFGAGVLIGILVIREWSLGAWGRAGVLAVGTMVLFAFLAAVQFKSDASASPSHNQAAIDRMVSDTPILGSGAGTFDRLLPIYREIDDAQLPKARATAALIIIEMGRAFLWISILVLVWAAILLARGGMTRGRDYVYASAGAGVVATILILIFVRADVLSVAASVFLGAVAGLSWAQNRSTIEGPAFSARAQNGIASASAVHPNEPRLRFAFALAGLILTIEAAWVLMAERHPSDIVASPFVDVHATVSSDQRERLEEVATIASWRGDLWANSAVAGAALLLKNPADPQNQDRTRGDLIRALRYAPYQSAVWLTFALLAEKYAWPSADPRTLLKMAYYTGPNEPQLIPARLKLAFRLPDGAADPELQDMIRQDVSLIFRRLPALKPVLVDAYKSGSPAGRSLEEQLITELDPDYVKVIRSQ